MTNLPMQLYCLLCIFCYLWCKIVITSAWKGSNLAYTLFMFSIHTSHWNLNSYTQVNSNSLQLGVMHGVEHVNDIASSCLTYTIMVHAHAIPVLACSSELPPYIHSMFCSWTWHLKVHTKWVELVTWLITYWLVLYRKKAAGINHHSLSLIIVQACY